MFQQSDHLDGRDAGDAGGGGGVPVGDVAPLAPGAVDRVRLGWVVEGADDDPWFDEGNYQPSPEDEELVFRLAHPEVDHSGFDHLGVEDRQPDEVDDPAVAARWHPAARVPCRLPGVEQMPGGAGLAALLAGVELPRLGAYELVEFIAACERVASAMHGLQARGIGELVRREQMRPLGGAVSMDPNRVTGVEIAARLARPGAEGEALVARADYLASELPDTFAAWEAGWLDTDKADLIARKLCRHDDALARRVEVVVLPQAPGLTVESLRRLITRTLHRLDPADAEARHKTAHQRRFVRITPTDDGMAWIEAYVSAVDAAAVKAVLGAAVAGQGGTGQGSGAEQDTHTEVGAEAGRPTAGNRRADALVALAWAALAAGRIGGCGACGTGQKLATAHGRPVTVNITIPGSSLAGVDDQPGYLHGYGPITADAARDAATAGLWRRILTDPATGVVLDVGRRRYRPPAELADHILHRDLTCVWPGCDRPATGPGIDIDHILDWARGGHTAEHNLGPFCEKHHTDKHHTSWHVQLTAPGLYRFTSPTGHTYTSHSADIGPVASGPESNTSSDPDPPEDPDPPDDPPF